MTANSKLGMILSRWKGGQITVRSLQNRMDIILDRPEKKNCLSGEMLIGLKNASEEAARMQKGVIVLQGNPTGKSFCSGADLEMIKQISDERAEGEMYEHMADVLLNLRQSSAVCIAKINGHCLGGATEISSAADIRIASKDAKIGFLQARMGIIPSWGGTEYLEGILGRTKALIAMARADIMKADDAMKMGWIDYVYEKEEEAEEFISKLSPNGLEVLSFQKKALNLTNRDRKTQKDLVSEAWRGESHKRSIENQLNSIVKKK